MKQLKFMKSLVSKSEVLANLLCRRHGDDAVNRLNGEFDRAIHVLEVLSLNGFFVGELPVHHEVQVTRDGATTLCQVVRTVVHHKNFAFGRIES